MPNGVDVYRALARRLYGKELPVLPTGIATGGTTGVALKDTVNLSYGSGNANALDGIYVLDETGYNYSRVTRAGWDFANSEIDFADIQSDFAAGDRYVLSTHHPIFLRNAVNDVLSSFYVDSFAPLSSHIATNDENDMETSPHITFYANKSASATLAEETSTIYNGAQALKITAGAATQYTHAGTFSVNENKEYYVSAFVSVTSGDSAELRVVNVDDSNAAIENATTDEIAWSEMAFQFTPPSGCERVQAWMISTANGDITYWDDYILVDTSQRTFRCPSWITSEAQLMDVVELPRGSVGPASDNDYRTLERRVRSINWKPVFKDFRAANELHVEVDPSASRKYILAKRPLSEIADWSTNGMTESGTSEAGSTTTLQDTGKTWIAGQWEGFTLTCTGGTGGGQERTIITNDANTVTVDTAMTAPGADTTYTIQGNRTEPFPINEIVKHCVYIIENEDERESYLAALRHASLGGARMYAPSRVYSQ
jgi:hypothetical protein